MAVRLALLLATLVCRVTAQCNTPWQDCGELLQLCSRVVGCKLLAVA